MNNLLRDIIQQEILSMNTDRTGLLERIIREELLKEFRGSSGYFHEILNHYLGANTDLRNPRIIRVDNIAKRNGADHGFVVISSTRLKPVGASESQLRAEVIHKLRKEPNAIGTDKYYDKTKYMYVLSNAIKRSRRSYKWHGWVVDKRPLMQIFNKIKSADDELYYRLYPAVEKINNAAVHDPQQAAAWVEMLKSAAKKANVEIPGAVANLNIQNIQKDVEIGSIEPFELEVDESGIPIDPKFQEKIFSWYIKGTPEKPGKVLVKYAADGMNYQLIPIYGKGAMRSLKNLVGDRGYWKGAFIGNFDEKGVPAEGEIIVNLEKSPGTIFSYFKGTLESSRNGTSWEDPSYSTQHIKGFVQYVDTNQKPDGSFTGTFNNGKINSPGSGKYGGSLKNTTGVAWEFDGTYKNGVQDQGTWTIPNTAKFVGKGPLETRNGTQTELISGMVNKGQWKDNKKWNTTQFDVLGQKTGETVKGKYEGVKLDDLDLKRDSKGPAVKKLKELLMITKQTEHISDDSQAWKKFLTEKDTDVIGPYTSAIIIGIKKSWVKRGYKSKKVGNEHTDVVNQRFIETLHKLNSDPVKYDSNADPKIQLESFLTKKFNLKQVALQEYNNIIAEQWDKEIETSASDTTRNVIQNIKQNKPVDKIIKKQPKKVQKKVIQQIEKAVTDEFIMGYIQDDYIHINPPRPKSGTINARDFVIISNTNWFDGAYIVNDVWIDKSGNVGAIKINTGVFLGYTSPERIMEGKGRIKLINKKELIDNLDKYPGIKAIKDDEKKEYELAHKIAADLVDKVTVHPYAFFNEFQNSRYAGGIIAMDDSYGAYKKLFNYYHNTWKSKIDKLGNSKYKWSRMNADILRSQWNFSINTIYENEFQLREKDYPEFSLYYLQTDRPGGTRYIHPWKFLSG